MSEEGHQMTATNPHEDGAAGASGVLLARPGPRPRTTPRAPHIQQDQNAPTDMQAMLAQRVFALPEVEEPAGLYPVAHSVRSPGLRGYGRVVVKSRKRADRRNTVRASPGRASGSEAKGVTTVAL
jgi:hypothetical protein